MSNAKELEALEVRVAYQDQSIKVLSDELYRQQQQIETLEETCRILSLKLQAMHDTAAEDSGEAPAQADTPPHY